MKSFKSITYSLGFVVLAAAIYFVYPKFIKPKIAASNLCKSEEHCLKALNIGENSALELNYSNDGKYLLGRGLDGTRLWNVSENYKAKRLGNSTAIAIALDRRYAIAKDNEEIRIFSAAGENMLEFSVADKTDSNIRNMVFVPGYDIIAMPIPGEERGKPLLSFWSTQSGEFITKLSHQSSIASLKRSEQGIIAVGQYNGKVILWPMRDLNNRKTIIASDEDATIRSMAFDKTGNFLATGDSDGNIKLWNVETTELIKSFEKTDNLISGLAISANGELLASSTFSGLYRLWNIKTGKLLESWQYPRGISDIAISPDSKHIAISLKKKVDISTKRVKNTKSYGPKWVEVESKSISPGIILIRDLSNLDDVSP